MPLPVKHEPLSTIQRHLFPFKSLRWLGELTLLGDLGWHVNHLKQPFGQQRCDVREFSSDEVTTKWLEQHVWC